MDRLTIPHDHRQIGRRIFRAARELTRKSISALRLVFGGETGKDSLNLTGGMAC